MTFRIEIAGGIAAGKSTLCAGLQSRGVEVIPEKLEENPYLRRTYNNAAARGFDVQMAFLLSKASAIETYDGASPVIACDYALVVEYAYTKMHLESRDPVAARLCREAVDLRRAQIGKPDMLIYLDVTPDEQLRRTKSRGRDFEQGLDESYLRTLNDEIRTSVETAHKQGEFARFITIDTNRTNVGDPAFMDDLVNTIRREAGLSSPSSRLAPSGPA